LAGPDAAETVALVARAKREVLLRVHGHRLRREDLEDCFGQATLELVAAARRGVAFASRAHVANALEQKLLSRIQDRRRAVSGRSRIQAAMEYAVPLGSEADGAELRDRHPDPERMAMLRHELGQIVAAAPALSDDQRLVIACQVALQMGCEQFCRAFGWSPEKYRKVAQRARAKLRLLLSEEGAVPPALERSESACRDRPMRDHPPHIGPSLGPPAVGFLHDGTARPIRQEAAGTWGSPRSGCRPSVAGAGDRSEVDGARV
jgi:DNA-directed RNA polymerase specialized sigma24 family protein